jgi:hypothetical protein
MSQLGARIATSGHEHYGKSTGEDDAAANGHGDDGYGDYPELFALSALTLALIAVVPLFLRRRRRVPSPGDALDDRVPFGDVVHRGDLEAGPGGEG